MRQSVYTRTLKRAIDASIASAALFLLSPLLAGVALAIVLDDGCPVLFRQTRIGRGGRRFAFLKFRSMRKGTEERPSADAATLVVTRVGRLIRRLSIDELPQLWNIVRGDMSLVGPRPAIPSQQTLCRLRVESGASDCPPGLTGLAQINAYDSMPEEEKAAWDARYAHGVSPWLDAIIVFRTIGYLFRPPPAY